MLDPSKYEKVKSGEAFADDRPSVFEDIKDWTLDELLSLRSEIETLLPATKLKEMDLEKEMVLQYHKLQGLQTRVLEDDRTPANQLAQIANSVTASLNQLVVMQTKHHTSERLKEIESRLIKALEKVPTNYLEEFFSWYESEAGK